MMYSLRSLSFRLLLLVITVATLSTCGTCAPSDLSREIRIGNEAAEDVERQVNLVSDEALLDRLNRIGQKLAESAKVTTVFATYGTADLAGFDYSFKIVDDKEINAFALPAGHIYINKGLIDYIRSDDELAAVLAHEIAHVAHHHSIKLLKKQSRMDTYIGIIALLSALGNLPGRDMQNLVYGAQMLKTSRMGGYGQEAELDADRTSVTYMMKAGYDPSAILRFLSRLASDVERKPNLPLGIFRTHPPFREREDNIVAELRQQGVECDLSGSAAARVAIVRGSYLNHGQIAEVAIAGKTLFRPADTPGQTSSQRATAIAAQLNSMLEDCDTLSRTKISCAGNCMRVNGEPVLVIEPEDTQLHSTTAEQLIRQARETLRFAIWCDWVHNVDHG